MKPGMKAEEPMMLDPEVVAMIEELHAGVLALAALSGPLVEKVTGKAPAGAEPMDGAAQAEKTAQAEAMKVASPMMREMAAKIALLEKDRVDSQKSAADTAFNRLVMEGKAVAEDRLVFDSIPTVALATAFFDKQGAKTARPQGIAGLNAGFRATPTTEPDMSAMKSLLMRNGHTGESAEKAIKDASENRLGVK